MFIFSKIKAIIAAVIGGAIAILIGWLKITRYQRDKAETEAEQQERRADSIEKKMEAQQDINKSVNEVRKESQEVDRENQERREDSRRPTGNFGDRRLHDDT